MKNKSVRISVVIPVYGCPDALNPLYERLKNVLIMITNSYEIILVNDGCPKGSWSVIEEICSRNKKVIGINLSRNFGQAHSTNCGIKYAKGEYVVLMDCDLQDRPEEIINLYNQIKKGYDIVFAKRKNRIDSKMTILLSRLFYKVYNSLIDDFYSGEIGNFCIVNRKVVNEYNNIKNVYKTFTSSLSRMGYKVSTIEAESENRFEGKSSYTLSKKIDLAINMLTSQSNKPLLLVIKLGMLIAVLSFTFLLIQIIKYFYFNNVLEGWTSIIASLFFVSSIILICLGVVGIYVGNIFNQVKGNPEYFVEEILNEK